MTLSHIAFIDIGGALYHDALNQIRNMVFVVVFYVTP